MTVPGTSHSDRARPTAPERAHDALIRLAAAGYPHRFELHGDRLRCPDCGASAHPADFAVEASFPVTDDAGPGTVFALECLFCGVKGTWRVAGGGSAEQAAISRLRDGRPWALRVERGRDRWMTTTVQFDAD